MLEIILLLLIIFWFAGYGPLTALHITLFSLGRFHVNLWDILILLLIIWLIETLPGTLRTVVVIILLVWLFSLLGILVIPMFSNFVIIALIVGLAVYLVTGH